jgi:hypothetical protein
MTINLLHARTDGTFVIERNGYPYHVTHADPLWRSAKAAFEENPSLPPEEPPVVTALPPTRLKTPLEFFDRFTADEEAAIGKAALSNAQVLLWLTKAAGASTIDLDDARTQAGVGLLVQAGLLTPERMQEVLA